MCNRHKGSEIAAIDIKIRQAVWLFNPRTDKGTEHLRLEEGRIIPLTPEGRVTEQLLQFNQPEFVACRKLLMDAGRYPPPE